MKNLFSILLISAISFTLSAQSLEESASVLYMKANVLYDAQRYDESVRMYNMVVKRDDEFQMAYLMRAKAKYELGAYKGTKKDIMEFIAISGVTKDVVKLMAKTELRLENYKAARNYAATSLELDQYDGEQYRVAGMIALADKKKNDACEYWSAAHSLGDRKASGLLEKYCGFSKQDLSKKKDRPTGEIVTKREEKVEEIPSQRPERKPVEIVTTQDKINERKEDVEPLESGKTEVVEKEKVEIERPDVDAIAELKIDDELTVVIGNGLGTRKINRKPNIFLLSDKSGRVVVDVCVDGEGKVISADLDKDRTSLIKPGLISLALRKTKEFEFYPSIREEQCGYFIYEVKTGE